MPEPKIVHYLLDLTHPVGRSKAEFFLRFGFTLDDWEVMAAALLRHAHEHEIAKTETTDEGERYVIEGVIHTPDERNPFVRSVWFIEQDKTFPQFVTCYPIRKKRES